MAYKLLDAQGNVIATADCSYDFNDYLEPPIAWPDDGDYYSIDDQIRERLQKELGYTVEELITEHSELF